MERLLEERINQRQIKLTEQLQVALKNIANDCQPLWQQSDKLDAVLASSRLLLPKCKLLYAVQCDGIQVSANIQSSGDVDTTVRGQNLADRPYMQLKRPENAFSLSPVYIGVIHHKPSITAMHQVIDPKNRTIMGVVAVDFDMEDLPEEEQALSYSHQWRQIKGDPAIRQNLFQQERVTSEMDKYLPQVNDIINNLISKRGIFHAKLHYSSSRATLWPFENPYEYRLHVLDEIIDPNVCLAYPTRLYPQQAKVSIDKITPVFERFAALRNADETIYLRAGSLNIMNGMVGLNFSCDGSHYMPVDEFLEKAESFWFGEGAVDS